MSWPSLSPKTLLCSRVSPLESVERKERAKKAGPYRRKRFSVRSAVVLQQPRFSAHAHLVSPVSGARAEVVQGVLVDAALTVAALPSRLGLGC